LKTLNAFFTISLLCTLTSSSTEAFNCLVQLELFTENCPLCTAEYACLVGQWFNVHLHDVQGSNSVRKIFESPRIFLQSLFKALKMFENGFGIDLKTLELKVVKNT